MFFARFSCVYSRSDDSDRRHGSGSGKQLAVRCVPFPPRSLRFCSVPRDPCEHEDPPGPAPCNSPPTVFSLASLPAAVQQRPSASAKTGGAEWRVTLQSVGKNPPYGRRVRARGTVDRLGVTCPRRGWRPGPRTAWRWAPGMGSSLGPHAPLAVGGNLP